MLAHALTKEAGRNRTKPNYLFIVLVTPLSGNNPYNKQSLHCCHGKCYWSSAQRQSAWMWFSFWRSERPLLQMLMLKTVELWRKMEIDSLGTWTSYFVVGDPSFSFKPVETVTSHLSVAHLQCFICICLFCSMASPRTARYATILGLRYEAVSEHTWSSCPEGIILDPFDKIYCLYYLWPSHFLATKFAALYSLWFFSASLKPHFTPTALRLSPHIVHQTSVPVDMMWNLSLNRAPVYTSFIAEIFGEFSMH